MADTKSVQSAIYEGVLMHHRLHPKNHSFSQNVAMVYLDLDELDQVFSLHPAWSLNRFNCASFRREDYHGDPALPLADAVRATVLRHGGQHLQGPVRMLTNLRYFGFIINPITCYYCFDTDEKLQFIVAEVTNTPWEERHAYVLPMGKEKGGNKVSFPKCMHVSPFMSMEIDYVFDSSKPDSGLRVHMESLEAGEVIFRASLQMKKRAMTALNMSRLLCRFPVMTMQVGAGIYWQALRLWWKGMSFVPHPGHKNTINQKSTETKKVQENSNLENI